MPNASDFSSAHDFRLAVTAVLEALLDQVDLLDAELDPQLTAGSLSVTFEDGSVFMLSQQTPTYELWLSANYTAWHFLRTGGQWVERDTGAPMLSVLSELFTDKIQQPVTLTLPITPTL